MTETAVVFKFAGAACILAGSIGLGAACAAQEKRRIAYLREILLVFRRMQDEITYGKHTLPEICLHLSECGGPLYRGCFRTIYELAKQRDGDSLPHIWEEQIALSQEGAPLSGEEKNLLLQLPKCLGLREEKQQAKSIGRCEEYAFLSCRRAEEAYGNKRKVIFSVSVLAGLFLTILLL